MQAMRMFLWTIVHKLDFGISISCLGMANIVYDTVHTFDFCFASVYYDNEQFG